MLKLHPMRPSALPVRSVPPRFPRTRLRSGGLRLRRYEVRIPHLDPAHEGLRIAHLTDIHVGMLTPQARIRRAVQLAREARPDLTVLTGDFVCYSTKFVEPMGELLSGLPGEVSCV